MKCVHAVTIGSKARMNELKSEAGYVELSCLDACVAVTGRKRTLIRVGENQVFYSKE